MRTFLPLLLACLMTPFAKAQDVQFTSQLDLQNNSVSWGITTSVGSVNTSPSSVKLGGTLDFLLDSANAPYQTGQINGGLSFTSPLTLTGEIPNPIPFFPPLAQFDLKNLEYNVDSPPFSIDPNTGDFTAFITLTVTNGENELSGLFGSGTESIAGIQGTPTAVNGNISQTGTSIRIFLDLNLQLSITDPTTGITVSVNFQGGLDSYTDASEANSMHLELPFPLIGGAGNTIEITNATPGQPLFIGGTIFGRGLLNIPQLGVEVGMRRPQQIATAVADAAGNASVTIVPPALIIGRSVLIECVEIGRSSNTAGSWVQ
jgi:hypothetical protein